MKIDLNGGDAPARSVLESTQRRLNMYAELIDPKQGEPGKTNHLPTPGLTLLSASPNGLASRCLYRATDGVLYAVAGLEVYWIDAQWVWHHIGTMTAAKVLNPVKMTDNGTNVCICDGTPTTGYAVNMKTRDALTNLYNPSASDELTDSSTGWLGSAHLDYSDGYIIANFLDTPTFFISNSENIIFDPLQFASKNSKADALIGAIEQHRVVWLIGKTSTEVWYNSGGGTTPGNNFPFSIMPGVSIDWGCVATYSIAKAETSIFWLAQNLNGEVVVLRGKGYDVQRISTHPIETKIKGLGFVADAIGWSYMQQGHSFYVLTFPTGDKTFVYDLSSELWHERGWLDDVGQEHRHRSTCHAAAYSTNVVNDHENGNIYALDLNNYTDNGRPIKRVISFPRVVESENDSRLIFKNIIAELTTGEGLTPAELPKMILDWSDDKGKTWSNALHLDIGPMGEYHRLVKVSRLGVARSRIFRLSWTANAMVSIQAAWTDVAALGS